MKLKNPFKDFLFGLQQLLSNRYKLRAWVFIEMFKLKVFIYILSDLVIMKVYLSKNLQPNIANNGYDKMIKKTQIEQTQDLRKYIYSCAKFVYNLVQDIMTLQPTDFKTFRTAFKEKAIVHGCRIDYNRYYLPSNITNNVNISLTLQSSSGGDRSAVKHSGENWYELYIIVIPIIEDFTQQNQSSKNRYFATLVHEFAHIFEELGTEPDELEEDGKVRTLNYLLHSGEMNSHAWEIAVHYTETYPQQPFDYQKLVQMAKTTQNNTMVNYILSFSDPAKQQLYAKHQNRYDLASAHKQIVQKIQQYVQYILQSQQ